MSNSNFAVKIKSLQEEFSQNLDKEGLNKLKVETISLKRKLNTETTNLSSYDLEHFSHDIDTLLRKIDVVIDKVTVSTGKKKKFQFKRQPKSKILYSPESSFDGTTGSILSEKKPKQLLYINKDLEINENVSIFKDLRNCNVISQKNSSPQSTTGSFTLSNISRCVVIVDQLPFSSGNIFITDAEDCIVILKLPTRDLIQVRMHNMKNCKISINMSSNSDFKSKTNESNDRQTIILEGCKNCVFDEKYKTLIDIQNFNDYTSSNSTSKKDYEFGSVATCDNNIMKLRDTYRL